MGRFTGTDRAIHEPGFVFANSGSLVGMLVGDAAVASVAAIEARIALWDAILAELVRAG